MHNERLDGLSINILQTERLTLREMTVDDLPALLKILQDEQAMYAYKGAMSDAETRD